MHSIDPVAVRVALEEIVDRLDYDLYKDLIDDDMFPDLTDEFIGYYLKAVTEMAE